MKSLIILILLVLISTSSLGDTKLLSIKEIETQWFNLKLYQKINLVRIFQRARKDNLSWTAVAIAWEESKFGRFQIGVLGNGSYDCGVMHNNTTSVLSRKGLNSSLYNKIGVCTNLIMNPEESYLEFVKEIRYWKRTRGVNNWRAIWRGYNAGYTAGGKNYSIMIGRRITIIKKYMPDLIHMKYNPNKLIIEKDPKTI